MRLTSLAVLAFILAVGAVQAKDRWSAPQATLLSPDALERLVSGVALYPDRTLDLILRAANSPGNIHEAARYVRGETESSMFVYAQGQSSMFSIGGSQPSMVWRGPEMDHSMDAMPLEIQNLVLYPDVLELLDENLSSIAAIGAANYSQPNDVKAAIARVRAVAEEAQAKRNESKDHKYVAPAGYWGTAVAPAAVYGWNRWKPKPKDPTKPTSPPAEEVQPSNEALPAK